MSKVLDSEHNLPSNKEYHQTKTDASKTFKQEGVDERKTRNDEIQKFLEGF